MEKKEAKVRVIVSESSNHTYPHTVEITDLDRVEIKYTPNGITVIIGFDSATFKSPCISVSSPDF